MSYNHQETKMQSSSLMQENPQENEGFKSGAAINDHFSLLHLSPHHNATSNPTSTTPSAAAISQLTTEDPPQVITNLPFPSSPSEPCEFCGNSLKRASPSDQPIDNVKSKKPFTSAAAITTIQGFNVLQLPPHQTLALPLPSRQASSLRRCNSTPIERSLRDNDVLLASANSPENLSGKSSSPARGSSSGSQLPPLPKTLSRAVSDPTQLRSNRPTSPPPPPQDAGYVVAPGTPLGTPRSVETGSGSTRDLSPAYKRLRRMTNRMKDIKQWFDEVMREDEQDSTFEPNISAERVSPSQCRCGTGQTSEKGNGETKEEEAEETTVSAERKGDTIILHFKCNCGSGYHILLSGKNCYYRLI